MAAGSEEVEHSLNSLIAVVQIGLIEKPSIMAVGFANVECVDSTWK